ncbi:MAG: sigma 54-interacting transcriptional regulator, partial [Deltaproteobacteria bacterium]|nr:sigma 54-interacting transcriptional regulator [Kofleriaceae bacterium]
MSPPDDEAFVTVPERSKAPRGVVRGFTLTVVDGAEPGKRFESDGAVCAIGSHAMCRLVIRDPMVSRFHCEIRADRKGARLRDTDSLNGTQVDGVRVVEAYLEHGSRIRVGGTTIRFELDGRSDQLALSDAPRFGSLVGESTAMRHVFAVLERAAPVTATVLLEGETGTGKTAAARSLHLAGPRRERPFVIVDCAAIPANLLESELFGHEKGAFTGADQRRIGAFEEADGGTLFLDEIGELPPELQPKLLSVLENRTVRRVGGSATVPVDVRIVAATHRDLRGEINSGRFRPDLYYRLAVVRIEIPPLRARPDDLEPIARQLLAGMGASPAQVARLLDGAALEQLRAATWPGNLRELRNYLERCLVFDEPLPIAEEAAAPAV